MKNVISRVFGLIIWFLIVLLSLNLVKDIGRARAIERQIQEEKDKIAKIEAENTKLESELARAQSPEFIEKQVRDKLGLGREGEAIVVLPEAEILRKLAPKARVNEEALPDPNWKKWLKLFI